MDFIKRRISELFLNQDGTFNDDTSGGRTASFVPAQWLNMIGRELTNLIESVGLTPDENNTTQLSQALDIAAPYQFLGFAVVDLNNLGPDPVPGWLLCDGTNGTPDLLDRYLYMSDTPGIGGQSLATTSNGGVTVGGASLSKSQGAIHTHGMQGRLLTSSGDTEGSAGRYSRSGSHTDSDTPIQNSPGGSSHRHSVTVRLNPPRYEAAPFLRADYVEYVNANGGFR